MAVGELERMAEQLTARGLGISPLASRAIQQAQLEGPQAALATSQATRSSSQSSRLANFARDVSKNYKYGTGGNSRAKGFDPNAPTALLSIDNRGQTVDTGAAQAYNLNIGGGVTPRFSNLDDVIKYISDRPEIGQVGLEGIGLNSLNFGEESKLTTSLLGRTVQRISEQTSDRMSGRSNSGAFNSMMMGGRGGGGSAVPNVQGPYQAPSSMYPNPNSITTSNGVGTRYLANSAMKRKKGK